MDDLEDIGFSRKPLKGVALIDGMYIAHMGHTVAASGQHFRLLEEEIEEVEQYGAARFMYGRSIIRAHLAGAFLVALLVDKTM